MTDLATQADVRTLVDAFYDGIEADDLLGVYFAGLEIPAHRARMVAFWSAVAFQTGTYRGRPFAPHARMPGLERAHFARWLSRWRATVDARFAGVVAERVKARAEQVAGVFQVKLGLWSDAPPAPTAAP